MAQFLPDAREVGVNVLSGGTDVHLILVDLRESELDGQQAEDRLHEVGITVNRNAVPDDPRPPLVTSGLRLGTPALATRGWTLVGLSVATSIDALAVGLSFAALGVDVWFPAAVIGLTAGAMTVLGTVGGRTLGMRFGKRMSAVGGLVLIAIGGRILVEHLGGA